MYSRCIICNTKVYQPLVWFMDKVFTKNPCVDCLDKYDIV